MREHKFLKRAPAALRHQPRERAGAACIPSRRWLIPRVNSDPALALKALNDNPPDLGVFDIKMPGMDGMELLRRLREFSTIPVIFLTSKDDELDEALGLAMGADDYISKPFSQRLLIARIRALLRRQELARGEAEASGGEPEPPLLERGRLVMDPAR